ncbi:hypothetical protein [Arthrobacter sp. D5-1]|uniref:hypothetical protein n=1 Tax=Arthrobacter sp. D5-1 TaxID=1477518 RepID=UPI001A995BA3|nr:hypothetical protein [Arthrobacter sp. D5-1]QSZ47922.1 hypothetical protein AYX22_05550 [Arthrobacter sp. D5-1]
MTTETSQEQLVDIPEWVSKVRAIGIDTNAVGKGSFNLAQLKGLSHKAQQHGAMEIWIAEPVIWEWADHLREDWVSLNKVRSNLKAAGIEMAAQPTDVNEALEFVLSGVHGLGEHVKVIPIEPVVVEAMKDQILVRAPGERVTRDGRAAKTKHDKSVKTGAADSAIFRAYHHHAGNRGETYVILGGDSDLAKAHEEWGVKDVKSFSKTDALNEHIFRMIPAPDYLVVRCAAFLDSEVATVDLTSFESPSSLIGSYDQEVPLSFAATGHKMLLGLSNAKLDRVAQIVEAEACILTDVFGPEVTTDIYGEDHEEPGTQRMYSDSAVYVNVTFRIEKGEVKSFAAGSIRHTWAMRTRETAWDDDGPLAVLENLTEVPGLADFDWAVNFYEPQTTEVEVDGDILQLDFSGSAADDWVLAASYRDEVVEVAGTLQYDGKDYGDGVSFVSTVLLSTDSALVPNRPSFAVNALLMHTPKKS